MKPLFRCLNAKLAVLWSVAVWALLVLSASVACGQSSGEGEGERASTPKSAAEVAAQRQEVETVSPSSVPLTALNGEEAGPEELNQVISVRFEGAPLAEALKAVARKARLSLAYDGEKIPAGKTATLVDPEITAREALLALLQDTALRLVLAPGGRLMLVDRGPPASTAPAAVQEEDLLATITGTVTDAKTGETLPGASVSVPGTTTGTATGPDGTYSLSVADEADSLRFSFVGYDPQTVAIDGRETIDVALSPASAALSEVVVIGYGEVEAGDVTGAVESVDAEEFNKAATISPEQLIAGKVAGVQISPGDGSPGGGNLIRIRGATSVNASSQPLFVVDDVPISNEGASGSRNPLNFLNPNDIASVTVLKDASATAIYGSRGANGVIIIETKSAEAGEGQLRYNGEVRGGWVADRIDVLGAERFRQVVREQAPQMMDRLGDAETDWQRAVQRTPISQEHNLSFSRGFEEADFRVSLSYAEQAGVLETSSTERTSVSINYNQQLFDDRLSIETRLRGVQNQNQFAPGLVGSAAVFAPTQPIRDATSEYGGFFEWDEALAENNPVAEFIMSQSSGTTYRGFGSVQAKYQLPFAEGLSLRTVLGYDLNTGGSRYFAPTDLKVQAESPNPGVVSRASFTRTNKLLDTYLSYNGTLEALDSQIDFTAGYSYQDFNEVYPEFSVQGLNTNIFGPNSTDPLDRRRIREDAEQRFGQARMAEQYVRVYEEVTRKRAQRSAT